MSVEQSRTQATVSVQRFNPDTDPQPYWQDFVVELEAGMTILDALHKIKAEVDGSLTFRRSCRHAICGSCAMSVNGMNKLVCEQPLRQHLDQDGSVRIAPLSFLPVIKDLVVDRETFWSAHEQVKPWLIPLDVLPEKENRVAPVMVEALKNAERCIMCGACYSACPVIAETKSFVGPHAMLAGWMRVIDPRDKSKDEHMSGLGSVWDCTTCYTCNLQCPKDLDPGSSSTPLRSVLVEDGRVPRTIGDSLMSTFRNNNPFGMTHNERLAWAEGLGLKDALAEEVDSLYFSCCLACYDPRAQKLAQALVKVMQSAGVSLGTLGLEEACCGSEARRIGEEGLFEMIEEERTALLAGVKSENMLVSSPHCLDVYKNHYKNLEIKTEHYTVRAARLIEEGKLTFSNGVEKKVTYHDPCYLGMQNKIFEEPRQVLRSIPGLELVEMERHGEFSYCCGGGGGMMWHESEGHVSHNRVRQALDTGAEIIATACPYCLNMLDDAVKSMGVDQKIAVFDIMELLSKAL